MLIFLYFIFSSITYRSGQVVPALLLGGCVHAGLAAAAGNGGREGERRGWRAEELGRVVTGRRVAGIL